jgi:hypothetical protein
MNLVIDDRFRHMLQEQLQGYFHVLLIKCLIYVEY